MTDRYLQKARRWHLAGDLQRAEHAYDVILGLNPNDPSALNFKGILMAQLGRWEEAQRLFERCVAVDDGYADAWANLGKASLKLDRTGDACTAYEAALALRPERAEWLDSLAVAHLKAGNHGSAIALGRQATQLDPDSALAWFHLGRALLEDDELDGSADALRRAVSLAPSLIAAHELRIRVLQLLQHVEAAPRDIVQQRLDAYAALLAQDPEHPTAGYMKQALSGSEAGEPPGRSPDPYIVKEFDQFAESFDERLARLRYRVPGLVLECVQAAFGDPGGSLDVLDAGCGTGLVGALLQPYARRQVGVDLSGKMLDKAREKAVYEQLHQAELEAWLVADGERFDVVVCADTLIYFGSLEKVIEGLAGRLAPGGLLIFTVQALDAVNGATPGWQLTASGRFSHGEAYVRRMVEAADLAVVSLRQRTLRTEAGRAVTGLLVAATSARD